MTGLKPAQAAAAERRAADLALEPMVPAGPTSGFFRGTRESLRSIWSYRGLLNLLFRRELKARYKDSALGFVWSLIRPLAQLAVYAIAIGQFLGASKNLSEYPIYVFSGLTIWQYFSEIISSGTGSILGNAGLVKKIYLPREVFPLSVVASATFNFLMQMIVLLVGTFAFRKPPHPANLIYGLMAVAIVLLIGTALAFVLSAVNVYLRDVQYIVEIVLMWGMWTAPIVYDWSLVSTHLHNGAIRQLYLANPITEAVLGFQRAFWVSGGPHNTIPTLGRHMAIAIGVGVVLLWIGQRVFARLEANFAQEL
ncbi:MAG: ABC transporter permease [Actinobacteria bacterium]|nr:ABC transporter permease [Actinomycetota bacterium]